MDYFFEWDPKKEKLNRQRHKVSFERASSIFRDPRALTIFDGEHSRDEERYITLGIDRTGIPLAVCHTFEEETKNRYHIRIISARKAKRSEIQKYKG